MNTKPRSGQTLKALLEVTTAIATLLAGYGAIATESIGFVTRLGLSFN